MKKTSPRRQRGRPRQFDEHRVLEAVLSVFWERGYSSASLDDLARAAGVTRPSLYTALGDKKSMYLHALDHFGHRMRTEFTASLNAGGHLRDDLLAAYLASVDLYTTQPGPGRGCLAVCTASAESFSDKDIPDRVAEILNGIDAAFTERFDAAITSGQLPPTTNAAAQGRLAGAALHSLALRARAGADRRILEELAQTAAEFLSMSANCAGASAPASTDGESEPPASRRCPQSRAGQ
ncbi:TetR/AcrR family transcriptional regulator [Mycobacterium pseudokansasii]|uniref:HTH-type transcriptional repressor ComR n=1 Tax=Mycobacterium pseudokansasii TaxID=2341080 RepID=A0A498QNA2_9MYCO|nr:TetR/AcrR family transcriptional regulator [Mycobacterium pseudokansasii]VBA49064.1 HTH-type transcriptional repressor ComR [Mycobacterium pseudokansasii]